MWETRAIFVKVEILTSKKISENLHTKKISSQILFYKMFFDLSQIFTQYKKHFDLKFLKF